MSWKRKNSFLRLFCYSEKNSSKIKWRKTIIYPPHIVYWNIWKSLYGCGDQWMYWLRFERLNSKFGKSEWLCANIFIVNSLINFHFEWNIREIEISKRSIRNFKIIWLFSLIFVYYINWVKLCSEQQTYACV